MTYPTVVSRKVIVEPDPVDGGFLVMLDNGHVHRCDDKFHVLGFVGRSDRACAKRRKAMIVSEIEWRNTPPGFVMPTPDEAAAYGSR